jgi:hypothetical protein
MKRYDLCSLLLIAVLSACQPDTGMAGKEIVTSTERLLDSLRPLELLASYVHEGGFTLLLSEGEGQGPVLKYTCRKGYAAEQDTLRVVSPGLYRSLKIPYLYLVEPHTVSEVFLRKIVHPSSNWQGQSPGLDSVRSTFRRTDRTQRSIKD